ncbi:rhodanese-like domain-containing protein [Streptomyces sp. NPDC127092]
MLYCHRGTRSRQALDQLLQLGFSDVRHLTGGIDAWAVRIDPTASRY